MFPSQGFPFFFEVFAPVICDIAETEQPDWKRSPHQFFFYIGRCRAFGLSLGVWPFPSTDFSEKQALVRDMTVARIVEKHAAEGKTPEYLVRGGSRFEILDGILS